MSKVDVVRLVDDIQKLSIEDLTRISNAVTLRKNYLNKQNIRSVIIGDRVSFSTKSGRQIGVVKKVGTKNVIVSVSNTMSYRVPAFLLTVEEQINR